MRKSSIVVVCASFESGRGTGHLLRSARLVRDLRERGYEALLCLAGDRPIADAAAFLKAAALPPDAHCPVRPEDLPCKADLIIVDRFRTPEEEALRWESTGVPILAVDEGGPWRERADFTLDLLPGLQRQAANKLLIHYSYKNVGNAKNTEKRGCSKTSVFEQTTAECRVLRTRHSEKPACFAAPQGRETAKPVQAECNSEPCARNVSHSERAHLMEFLNRLKHDILVTFGGEDGKGLGEAALSSLQKAGFTDVTLAGPGNYVQDLSARMGQWSLVITHFGLSAFEALSAGCSVVLLSPTVFHEKLARKAGFISCGTGKKAVKKLVFLLKNAGFREKIAERSLLLTAKYAQKQNYADFIAEIEPEIARKCPVCGVFHKKAPVFRFPERTFRYCPECGLYFQSRLFPTGIKYAEDYFLSDYKKQYGVTYIEDFPNLVSASRLRLARLTRFLPPQNGKRRLLDIGCAYGAFLSAAKEAGFAVQGIDAAASAVSFVKEKLRLNAEICDFPGDFDAKNEKNGYFDAISLWFVIEHFLPEKLPISLKKAANLLKKGGVFAFSTPSANGVSARKSLRAFLEKSPADHWTVWSPAKVKKALAKQGFCVKKIVITGHHPERFPVVGPFLAARKGSLLWKAALLASRALALGDTFEVYAVKM